MTVRREARRTFDVGGERLVEAARRVLDDDPIYRDTTEDGRSFTTTVKPNPFVLETAMRVRVRLDEGDVGAKWTVRVASVSPPSVHADVFGFYDRYLQDFLAALARRLEDPDLEGATPQGPRGGGLRGLWSTWHGRHLLAFGLVLVLLLIVLPVGLALAGFGGFALNIAFFPFAWAAGLGLARFSGMVRRRLGLVAAVPAAVFGFVAVAALLVVVGLFVSGAVLPGRSSSLSMVGSGLVLGIFWASFSRSKPDGFDGEVSPDRDVRGPRG